MDIGVVYPVNTVYKYAFKVTLSSDHSFEEAMYNALTCSRSRR